MKPVMIELCLERKKHDRFRGAIRQVILLIIASPSHSENIDEAATRREIDNAMLEEEERGEIAWTSRRLIQLDDGI
jgi:hypothetical protein